MQAGVKLHARTVHGERIIREVSLFQGLYIHTYCTQELFLVKERGHHYKRGVLLLGVSLEKSSTVINTGVCNCYYIACELRVVESF